jgi:hypothetical protein|tara:strand:+ start:430 stop:663 length:234 start_codon:yes stop_codon:yes gene_type:complete
VKSFVDRVVGDWDFEQIIPAHWAAPIDATPVTFKNAFRFLEDDKLDPFNEGDMRRGLKPIADSVVKGRVGFGTSAKT